MRKTLYPLAALCLLSSCGSITLPAAVKMESGEALTGTTTAATSGGTFQVASPAGTLNCSGNYDPFDTAPVISAPVRCSDGRYGTITVLRSPEGRSGIGTVTLVDGATGKVAFGSRAAEILQPANGTSVYAESAVRPSDTSPALPQVSEVASSNQLAGLYNPQSVSGVSSTYSPRAVSSRTYTGNCPTPDSYDAAGRRCGARSAASRPGGYDGYGSWASSRSYGGRTFVGGYYRKNGTYVGSHYRRR